jgi:hypothetical protein
MKPIYPSQHAEVITEAGRHQNHGIAKKLVEMVIMENFMEKIPLKITLPFF